MKALSAALFLIMKFTEYFVHGINFNSKKYTYPSQCPTHILIQKYRCLIVQITICQIVIYIFLLLILIL